MKIAVILFTYNRYRHTKMVLDALSGNTILPQKLFIFQDGMKPSTDKEEWNAVGDVISSVSWCDTEVMISEKNKGLAESIKTGVDYVFQRYDAVIVLEDDCVPHPQFMEYMVKALTKYEKCKKVYHIGACSEPVNVEENGTDAYFLGRINSWGWGTWKDRWSQFRADYTMIGKMKADSEMNEWFKLWGEDLESHVLGNVYGRTDSWAVFWTLTVLMNYGYCMAPYESFINNIGFDGTGRHCGMVENTLRMRAMDKLSEIVLPDEVTWVKNYKKSFAIYYPWTSPAVKNEYYKNVALDLLEIQKTDKSLAVYLKSMNISNIMLWGKGRFCDYLIDEFYNQVSINAIIETVPKGNNYKGIPIIGWREIPQNIPLIILIPGYDMDRIKKVIDNTELQNKIVAIDQLIHDASHSF